MTASGHKKRGRPKGSKNTTPKTTIGEPKKRGRPPKSSVLVEDDDSDKKPAKRMRTYEGSLIEIDMYAKGNKSFIDQQQQSFVKDDLTLTAKPRNPGKKGGKKSNIERAGEMDFFMYRIVKEDEADKLKGKKIEIEDANGYCVVAMDGEFSFDEENKRFELSWNDGAEVTQPMAFSTLQDYSYNSAIFRGSGPPTQLVASIQSDTPIFKGKCPMLFMNDMRNTPIMYPSIPSIGCEDMIEDLDCAVGDTLKISSDNNTVIDKLNMKIVGQKDIIDCYVLVFTFLMFDLNYKSNGPDYSNWYEPLEKRCYSYIHKDDQILKRSDFKELIKTWENIAADDDRCENVADGTKIDALYTGSYKRFYSIKADLDQYHIEYHKGLKEAHAEPEPNGDTEAPES